MAQQHINYGTTPNDGTGDTLRTSQVKAESNFNELYAAVTGGSVIPAGELRLLRKGYQGGVKNEADIPEPGDFFSINTASLLVTSMMWLGDDLEDLNNFDVLISNDLTELP